MGSVMGGQVILEGDAPDPSPILAQSIPWEEDPKLVEAFQHVHRTTYKKLVASVYLLRDMMQNLLEKEYRKIMYVELEKKSQELREERATRMNLEGEIQNASAVLSKHQRGSDFVLDMLNIISQMAYLEGIRSIESVACDFADIMRYTNDNVNNNFVTIGEELKYIEHYLRVQKIRMGNRLDYKITASKDFENVLSPYMLLQPVVDNALVYGIRNNGEKGKLEISLVAEEELLLITVEDNGGGISQQQIEVILNGGNKYVDNKTTKSLSAMNYLFRELFGKTCGLRIRSKEEGVEGTQVQIRLPLNNNGAFMKYFTHE